MPCNVCRTLPVAVASPFEEQRLSLFPTTCCWNFSSMVVTSNTGFYCTFKYNNCSNSPMVVLSGAGVGLNATFSKVAYIKALSCVNQRANRPWSFYIRLKDMGGRSSSKVRFWSISFASGINMVHWNLKGNRWRSDGNIKNLTFVGLYLPQLSNLIISFWCLRWAE